jgi:hypothetical protein
MAQTGGRRLCRESSSPPVSAQSIDQLDGVGFFGCDETAMAHELVRRLLENRPHAEATDLPALNLRRQSFDHILSRDRLSDGKVSRDIGIAEDLMVPRIEIPHPQWPEPQSLCLDLGHVVSMAAALPASGNPPAASRPAPPGASGPPRSRSAARRRLDSRGSPRTRRSGRPAPRRRARGRGAVRRGSRSRASSCSGSRRSSSMDLVVRWLNQCDCGRSGGGKIS